MNKSELLDALVEKSGFKKSEVTNFLDSFIDVIISNVSKGEKIAIPGFGTFELRTSAARTGINPLTKAPIQIAAKSVAKFKLAKQFKESLPKP